MKREDTLLGPGLVAESERGPVTGISSLSTFGPNDQEKTALGIHSSGPADSGQNQPAQPVIPTMKSRGDDIILPLSKVLLFGSKGSDSQQAEPEVIVIN